MAPSDLSDLFRLSDVVVQRPDRDLATGPWTIQEQDFPADQDVRAQLRFLLGYAILAPSIRNTQPWRARLRDDGVELWLERARVLTVADPEGRAAHLSCGAAISALQLGLTRHRVPHTFELLPDPARPELLARVRCTESTTSPTAPPPEEQWMLQSLPKRRTLRGPMAAQAVSPRLCARLVELARASGCDLTLLPPGHAARAALVELIEAGAAQQQADATFRDELERWSTRAPEGCGLRSEEPGGRTFAVQAHEEDGRERWRPARGREIDEGAPLLAILSTASDDAASWLSAGAALLRVLLRGRVDHLWASYFGQATEVPGVRARLGALLHDIAPTAGPHPQLVMRLGHGGDVAPSPRMPVDVVLEQDGSS